MSLVGRATGLFVRLELRNRHAVSRQKHVRLPIAFELGVGGEVPKRLPKKALLERDALDTIARFDHVVSLTNRSLFLGIRHGISFRANPENITRAWSR